MSATSRKDLRTLKNMSLGFILTSGVLITSMNKNLTKKVSKSEKC